MRGTPDDVQSWLASLSNQVLSRLNSRLTYLLRLVDIEMHRRQSMINYKEKAAANQPRIKPTNPYGP